MLLLLMMLLMLMMLLLLMMLLMLLLLLLLLLGNSLAVGGYNPWRIHGCLACLPTNLPLKPTIHVDRYMDGMGKKGFFVPSLKKYGTCFDYLLGEPINPWCWFWVPQPSANSYRPRPCFKDSCHCPVYLEPMALGLLENVGTPPPGNESISGKSLTRKYGLGGDNLLVHVLSPRRVFLVDHFVRNPLTQRPRERLVSWSQENWRDPWWVDRRQELLIHGTNLLPTRPLRCFFSFLGGACDDFSIPPWKTNDEET